MKHFKEHYIDYLLMFFLLGISGFPYFGSQNYLILFVIGLTILFITRENQNIDEAFLYMIGIILFLVLCQAVIFHFFKGITILGLVLRISSAYLVVKLLKEQFINYYLRVMVFLSIVSLIFFIPMFLIPGLMDKIINATPSFLSYQYELWGYQIDRKTLIIYNLLKETDLLRNNGPFWEPGAFGGFLTVAFMFNSIKEKEVFTKINFLLLFTIITTQSTTAYLAAFLFIFLFILVENYSNGAKLAVLLFAGLGYFAFQTIPFLGNKIMNENAGVKDAIEDVGGDTRMASAVLDWQDISGYPFTGRGIWSETRVDKKFEFVIRNNGFTNFFAQWGIPFVLFFFYLYYKSFYYYSAFYSASKLLPIILILIICVLAFSENYFNTPFFWSLTFLFIPIGTFMEEEDVSVVERQ